MTQSTHSSSTKRNLRRPEWLVPWVASLVLHLLLLGAVALWLGRQREVVWVDLLEARLLRTERQGAITSQPAAQPVLRQTDPPAPRKPRSAVSAPVTPQALERPVQVSPASRPEPQAVATARFAASGTEAGGRETTVVPAAPPAAVSPVDASAAGRGSSADEVPEQRYLSRQFAYIREQVMARLVYPPLARRQGWSGQVMVEFTVCADGSIEALRVVGSSGRSLLDRQALLAVQAAAPFPKPPVPARISLPVSFNLASARH